MGLDKRTDLSTRQASFKEVISLAWPMIVSMASMSILGLVDTYFMGWIGPEAQAAVGFGAPSTFSVMSVFLGCLAGLTTFVSQYFGAKRFQDCSKMLWHTLYLAAFLGLICTIFMPSLIDWLLVVMHVNPEFLSETSDYMTIRMQASVWVFLSYSLLSFLRGKADMKTPCIVSLVSVALNVPLTYIFAFGLGPIPAYGVAGAAIGTVISQAVEMILCGIVVFGKTNHQLFSTRRIIRPELSVYKEYARVAIPVGVAWAVEQWGWLIYGLYVSSLSKAEAAANAITGVFMNMAFMPGLAISIAATTLVGQYLGANNPKTAEKSANYAIILSIIVLCTLGALCFIFRQGIAHAFSSDPEVIRITVQLFYFACIYQVFDAAGVTTSGALRGAGDTKSPMFICTFCVWGVMIPLVYIQDYYFGWGVYGAWGAATLMSIVMGCCYFGRYKQGKWKQMSVR